MTAAGNTNAVVSVTLPGASQEAYAVLSIDGDATGTNWGPNNGYSLFLTYNATAANSSVGLHSFTGGSDSTLTTVTKTLSGGTTYRARLQRTGQTLQARVWPASGSEPSTWDLSYSITGTPLTGKVSLTGACGYDANPRTYLFDDLAVTTA